MWSCVFSTKRPAADNVVTGGPSVKRYRLDEPNPDEPNPDEPNPDEPNPGEPNRVESKHEFVVLRCPAKKTELIAVARAATAVGPAPGQAERPSAAVVDVSGSMRNDETNRVAKKVEWSRFHMILRGICKYMRQTGTRSVDLYPFGSCRTQNDLQHQGSFSVSVELEAGDTDHAFVDKCALALSSLLSGKNRASTDLDELLIYSTNFSCAVEQLRRAAAAGQKYGRILMVTDHGVTEWELKKYMKSTKHDDFQNPKIFGLFCSPPECMAPFLKHIGEVPHLNLLGVDAEEWPERIAESVSPLVPLDVTPLWQQGARIKVSGTSLFKPSLETLVTPGSPVLINLAFSAGGELSVSFGGETCIVRLPVTIEEVPYEPPEWAEQRIFRRLADTILANVGPSELAGVKTQNHLSQVGVNLTNLYRKLTRQHYPGAKAEVVASVHQYYSSGMAPLLEARANALDQAEKQRLREREERELRRQVALEQIKAMNIDPNNKEAWEQLVQKTEAEVKSHEEHLSRLEAERQKLSQQINSNMLLYNKVTAGEQLDRDTLTPEEKQVADVAHSAKSGRSVATDASAQYRRRRTPSYRNSAHYLETYGRQINNIEGDVAWVQDQLKNSKSTLRFLQRNDLAVFGDGGEDPEVEELIDLLAGAHFVEENLSELFSQLSFTNDCHVCFDSDPSVSKSPFCKETPSCGLLVCKACRDRIMKELQGRCPARCVQV